MDTFFFLLALCAVAPFVYHLIMHGVRTPMPEIGKSGMLRVRYWPSAIFLIWMLFNALILMSLIGSQDDVFMYNVYHDPLLHALYTPLRIFINLVG